MDIYTHVSVDLDAVASVWAVKRYFNGAKDASINFRSARWDGSEMRMGDVAVDIDAGGKGIKGKRENGLIYSSFKTIMEQYAPKEDFNDLKHLIDFIDTQDSIGSSVEHFIKEASEEAKKIFSLTGINAVLRALQAFHQRDDETVCQKMSDIFDGMLYTARARRKSILEAEKAERLPNGIAILRNARMGTHRHLFDQGVRVVVYVDGHNLGIVKKNGEKINLDHPRIINLIKSSGELKEWFFHEAGYLACRGSRKGPVRTPSKINPIKLAKIISEII